MSDIKIERPTVSRVQRSEDRFTYEVTCKHWQNSYTRNGSGSKKSVEVLMKKFEQSFDKEATMIENGEVRPHNIMKDLVDNNLFRRIRKIEGFTC